MELNNSPYKRVKHRLQTPTLARKFHFSHWFPGGADGRTYGHVIIKVSPMDRSQNLLGIWHMGLRARVRVHVEPGRYKCECKCRMVLLIQSDSHSCTTCCDAMFLSIPFYKMKVILFQYFDAIVSKKLCICIKEEGKFNHQRAQKHFPSSK